jgi:hypothetical protein
MIQYTPQEAVNSFLATLSHYVQVLTASLGLQTERRVLRQFVESTWSGERARAGRVGEIEFTVHGRVGCRLQAPEGGQVDIEVLPDGRVAFDAWRVQQFALSLGQPAPDRGQVDAVCEELAIGTALERVREHWYATGGD